MENRITVLTENGETTIDILDIFTVEGYEDKDYVLYTQNKEIDNNNIQAFVSILQETEEGYNLQEITDEKEWHQVNEAIKETSDMDE